MVVFARTTLPAPPASAAHRVLCDPYIFRSITSFQRGFPRDIAVLVRANDTTFRPQGWLPALVLSKGDLRMLQRLYRLYMDQLAVYGETSVLSFCSVWLDALQAGNLEAASWILRHDQIKSDHEATVALRFAIASQRGEVVEWLLQRRPAFKTEFLPEAIQDCPTLEMFQWLEKNIQLEPTLTQLVDCAADKGRLEIVKYVFSRYHGSCTSRAVVGAASNGHLETVQFLHEHAHEQCSCNAMRAAAWHGHLDIVRYINEHCSEGHGDAFELAALAGHLDIVMYLMRTRTDIRVMRAHMLVAQSGQHPQVQAYLSAILNPARYGNVHTEFSRGNIRTDGTRCSLL